MTSLEEATHVLDGVDVKCPECGKKPAKQTVIGLDDGIAKSEMECCHGSGYVMVHVDTGYVVDAAYKNSNKSAAAQPAFIPLVFVGTKKTNGATTRTIGWLNEKLPVETAAPGCGAGKSAGFWGKVKRCLTSLWN
jgi:rubredoxin